VSESEEMTVYDSLGGREGGWDTRPGTLPGYTAGVHGRVYSAQYRSAVCT